MIRSLGWQLLPVAGTLSLFLVNGTYQGLGAEEVSDMLALLVPLRERDSRIVVHGLL
jgi:hypothetical protein